MTPWTGYSPRAMRGLRTVVATLFVLLASGALASSAEAQKRDAALGPHLGINFDGDNVLVGGHGRFDVANVTPEVVLQIYPNLSYYFSRGDWDVFNLSCDVPFEFVINNSSLRPYAAPGLALFWSTGPGNDDIDLGLDLIGGLLFELGSVEPWFELRVIISGGASAELRGGVQFVL